MPIRSLTSPDPVLHRIGPFGLAASAGTALVIDLDPNAAPYPGPTLRHLAEDGITSAHLRPPRSGVALIANGGVLADEVSDLVRALADAWPAVVVRQPAGHGAVPVLPLEPAEVWPHDPGRAVWQASTPGSRARGLVLPPLRRSTVRALCRATVAPRARWVRAWRPIWGPEWA